MNRSPDQESALEPYRLHPAEAAPEPTEQDLAVIPGEKPGTAVRLRRDDRDPGSVWMEQWAFSPALGWYRQRSFPVPRQMLKEIGQALKLADCLATDNPTATTPATSTDRPDAHALRFPGHHRASG